MNALFGHFHVCKNLTCGTHVLRMGISSFRHYGKLKLLLNSDSRDNILAWQMGVSYEDEGFLTRHGPSCECLGYPKIKKLFNISIKVCEDEICNTSAWYH